MTRPFVHPTRLLRWVAVLARWSLGLLLALGLLLTLAWGTLHGWIVPRIGEYRAFIEERAEQALGVPVRLGAISARTEGLIPTFELGDVVLLDAKGRQALRLPQVVVAISPRSLLSRGFEQLFIQGPQVDVRRTADGHIWVAGLDVSAAGEGSGAADWLFSQPEVVVRGGRVLWTDELRGAPPLALEQVDVLLQNNQWRHAARLDATPPAGFGERFTLSARMREPLLSVHSGRWQQWSGQVFASFPEVDVSRLGRHADLGTATLAQGRGAVRAWLDVERGQAAGGVADVALAHLDLRLAPELEPLVLRDVAGRVGGRRNPRGFQLFTQNLRFVEGDGEPWPGGNLRLDYQHAQAQALARGSLDADQLDLAALSRIAARLPFPDAMHHLLRRYGPQGRVERIHAGWQGPLEAPTAYEARGRIRALALADTPAAAQALAPGEAVPPGVRGADVDFDLTQQGGKATLQMKDGALWLPSVFEEPLLPLTRLQAEVNWKQEGESISVQVPRVQFANADAAGEATASWHTSDPAHSPAKARFPGVLDLSGQLQRADGTRVHRYLPLVVPAEARHYVRDAVQAGRASSVTFRVRGDLHDMPFDNPRQGEFRIAARVQDVTYAYVPPQLQDAGEVPWPALVKLSGELIFERSGMQVKGATGSFAGRTGVVASGVEAQIPDLSHSVVSVAADARGPMPELLAFVAQSPLAAMTGKALAQATGSGNGELRLRLQLPISELAASKVQGSLKLAGSDVRITPDTPLLARARGSVQFTESGFSLAGVQARALGGEVRIEGGMRSTPGQVPSVQLRVQGTASAEGLQQARELGLLSELARRASGSAPYTLGLTVRHGVAEIALATSLQGLALDLPAPLAKPADASLPVRFENQLTAASVAATPGAVPLQDRLNVEIGALGALSYLRELGQGDPKVLSGSIALGVPASEARGGLASGSVEANLRFGSLDVDAWEAVLSAGSSAAGTAKAGSPKAASTVPGALQAYLPDSFALQASSLRLAGRTLHDLVVGGSREGVVWRANLDAQELAGYLEYRQANADAGAGGLFARLSRLSLPESAVSEVDNLLAEQPASLPALDIVVEAFELRGRKLGRLEIDARNRGVADATREWRLAKFNLSTPEASFAASGNWAQINATRPGGAGPAVQRRTVLNFSLDMRDAGQLLARMGMQDVVLRGRGRMDGQVAWLGAPISPDYRSMTGQIHLDVGAGQFLKAEPGLAKLLSVLSLQALPRRFSLDFRDLFSQGFAFDFVRGDVGIERGVATTNNLQMKGVNAAVLMEGRADIERETQDLHVVVVPEINALTASLVATAINPVIGLGSFLAQVFLRGPLIAAATQEYSIRGTWSDPEVTKLPRRRLGAPPAATAPAAGPSAPATEDKP
ncbi:MAG: TIGR02099 family protein [Simplicispira suum]|uniref:YhdP family protein n=1 Tax=Simplicispira suum TaxID=2109915 RepID=UPI001C6BDC6A|nr:YhdP family protein [Simplicispira suum]MBW7834826.1 TIGR02099 family protein [Simplicispira suum]